MSERLSLEIELRGVDDASDELKAVAENVKGLNQTMAGATDAAFKTKVTVDEVSKALERNNITSIQSADAAAQVLRESQANTKVLKAVAEQAEVFSDRAEFMANQLNRVASFGAKVNNIYNSVNSMMTRLNTAQIAYNNALTSQASLLDMVNTRFGLHATTIDEAVTALEELRAGVIAGGGSTKTLDEALKQLTASKKQVTSAANELAAAQSNATQQTVALAIQAVGLVPSFMQAVNAFSTLASLAPKLGGALTVVKTGFMGLYAAMGPIGIILIAIGALLPIIAMHWEEISAVLQTVADAVWSVLGPALTWIWENILIPLFNFIKAVAIVYLMSFIAMWEAVKPAVNTVAGTLQWIWDNILIPLFSWIVSTAVEYIRKWVGVFEWARDQINSIMGAIRGVVEGAVNAIRGAIQALVDGVAGAFNWLRQTLVGGSIIPDMWEDIREWTRWGVDEMNKFMSDVGLEMRPTVRGPVAVTINVSGVGMDVEQLAETISRRMVSRLRAL